MTHIGKRASVAVDGNSYGITHVLALQTLKCAGIGLDEWKGVLELSQPKGRKPGT